MSKKATIIGGISGAATLAIAFPFALQIASAAGTTSSQNASVRGQRTPPSQACVQALAAKDDAFLSRIDAQIAAQKTAIQAHKAALTAAAALTDDTARQAALKKADEDLRAAMKAAMPAPSETEMQNLKTACGNSLRGFGGMGPGPMGMMGPEGHGRKGPRGFQGSMMGRFRGDGATTEDSTRN